MKSIFQSSARSRRHRQVQAPENQQEQQQPFFASADQKAAQTKPQPFFQAKLAIGKPGDPYEREADAVADAVVNQQHSGKVSAGGGTVQRMPITPVTSGSLQRLATPDEEKMPATNDGRMAEDKQIQEKPLQKAEEEEPVQAMEAPKEEEKPVQKAEEEEEPVQAMEAPKEEEKPVQKAEEEEEPMQAKEKEEEPIQTKSQPGAQPGSANLSHRLSQRRGSGNPLPKSVKSNMEQSFGTDFSAVRVHTDSSAVDMNRDLHAQAFTHGQDIYFNSGKFNPEQTEGTHLLAHELTHVVQQGGGIQKKEEPSVDKPDKAPGVPVADTKIEEKQPESTDPLTDDDYVNTMVDGFPDSELKNQIGPDIKNRRGFLQGMQVPLGNLQDVITHFNGIRRTNVPGEVHLHNSAATRLEMVNNKLVKNGGIMPASTVALGLRGRYWHKHNRGLMAHPCGYAIDFRAYENPHLTDQRLVKLIEMQTGGQVNMDLGGYGERRSLIKEMGEANAAGTIIENPELVAKSAQFLTNLETQFAKVSQTSKKFQAELPDTRAQLFDYQKQMKDLSTRLTQIAKKRKNKKSDKESLAKEEHELIAKKSSLEIAMQNQLPIIFAPWIFKIDLRVAAIKFWMKVHGLDPDSIANEKDVKTQIQKLKTQIQALKKEKKEIETKIAKKEKEFKKYAGTVKKKKFKNEQEKLQAFKEYLTRFIQYHSDKGELKDSAEKIAAKISLAEKQMTILPKAAEIPTLESLKSSLSTDFNFVFGSGLAVKNPSIVQLLQKGFFNEDTAPAVGEKINPNKHGFNLMFIKTMAEYGFDLGVAWNAGSSDPMHFELATGVDSLKNPSK